MTDTPTKLSVGWFVPAVVAKSQCDRHGEYDHRYLRLTAKNVIETDTCPECEKEELEKLKQQEAEQTRAEEQKRLEAKLTAGGVSIRNVNKHFGNYHAVTESQQSALSRCKRFADQVERRVPANLILCGSVGVGKTHLATAICASLPSNRDFRIVRCIDMIRQLKSTWDKGSATSEAKMIKHFSWLDLLVIDEVGIQFETQTEKMFLFEIINNRYDNQLPTMLMSNLNLEAVKACIGDQAADRLREDDTTVVNMNWKSYRAAGKAG